MPIVAHSSLPVFDRLSDAGGRVLTLDQALRQDIRELHIGLLNMMPDSALQVTELQFLRMLGSANSIVQLYVHPFTIPGLGRAGEAQSHIDRHYEDFDDLREQGLDALIVTGANVSRPNLQDEAFWEPLGQITDWARTNVTSVLCSCLATHALLQRNHDVQRRRMATKRWGVYAHRATPRAHDQGGAHPLLKGTNTRFDVPHSRWNEVTSSQLAEAGLEVLVESVEGDVQMATSPDGIRTVYFQGHPEYDAVSLLKEFKREVVRYSDGELDELPAYPDNYLVPSAARIARQHLDQVHRARQTGAPAPDFPEDAMAGWLDNTWRDTGKAIFNNWLGMVYRLTNMQRGVPFMDHVDPDDPLASLG